MAFLLGSHQLVADLRRDYKAFSHGSFFNLFSCVIIEVNDSERSERVEKDFWQGVRDALPTALGYISIGLACGVVASPYLSPLEMALMSVLVYAGAA